jgi:hypothetical protein
MTFSGTPGACMSLTGATSRLEAPRALVDGFAEELGADG